MLRFVNSREPYRARLNDRQGLHLLTMNTPNGQAVQIMLEELKEAYGTEWSTTLINIMSNEQKVARPTAWNI